MMTFVQRTSEGPSQPDMIGLPVFQVSYVCGSVNLNLTRVFLRILWFSSLIKIASQSITSC